MRDITEPLQKGGKHAQLFLPVSFLTLGETLIEGLGEKEMGSVAKLNLRIRLCATPFHISGQEQFIQLTLGKSLSVPIMGVAMSFLGLVYYRKLGMG